MEFRITRGEQVFVEQALAGYRVLDFGSILNQDVYH